MARLLVKCGQSKAIKVIRCNRQKAKIATDWVPQDGYWGRGRPKRRWWDALDKSLPGWSEVPQNREVWVKEGEACGIPNAYI